MRENRRPGTHRAAVASALAAVLVVAQPTGPAAAETKSVTDPRGDAPARFDMTKIVVDHTESDLNLVVSAKNLNGSTTQLFGSNIATRGDTDYVLRTVRYRSGKVRTTLKVYDGGSRPSLVSCGGLQGAWRLGASTIKVDMPRSCIEPNGALELDAAIGAGSGKAGDPADYRRSFKVAQG